MAKTSTLTIKLQGTPLVGAEVISCALEVIAITDAEGEIEASLPDDYASCVLVAVRHAFIGGRAYAVVCILEAGENYEIDIPSVIGGGDAEIYGIHANRARKI